LRHNERRDKAICVIAVKPAGVKWPGKIYMKNCFLHNNDGAGVAWVDDGGLHVQKGYFPWKRLWRDINKLEEYPVLLHCRMATTGSISIENCHPFMLKNNVAIAHNGIIDITPMEKNMTDSETFGKKYLEHWKPEDLSDDRVKCLFETALGPYNKIAILKPDGSFIILNEDQGEVFQDVWFSNSSYDDWTYPIEDLKFDVLRGNDGSEAYHLPKAYNWYDDPFYANDTLSWEYEEHK
jgi:glutamine amidotransferase